MFDGGSVCEKGILSEAYDLVSCIGYFYFRALLEEVETSNDVEVVEIMVEGRR